MKKMLILVMVLVLPVLIACDGNNQSTVNGDEGVANGSQIADNGGAETMEPPDFSTTPMLSAGAGFSLALRADGTVWHWGRTPGLGETNTPMQVENLTNITAISAGVTHAMALRYDGTVWTWHRMNDAHTTPTQLPDIVDVIAISAGFAGASSQSLVLLSDGSLYVLRGEPMLIATDVVDMSVDSVLKSDGTVWRKSSPMQWQHLNQIDGLENIIAIEGATALCSDGTVWIWGDHPSLGVAITQSDVTDIIAVTGGPALRNDDTVWQVAGEPQQVENLSEVVALSFTRSTAGGLSAHSLALREDGTVWAWGVNTEGQLGDGTTSGDDNTNRRDLPAQVLGENGVGYFNLIE